jgi:uncharacterized cofD-like protein
MTQKIVTIGGGTGSFVVLSGLKNYPIELSAIVSMADNGGSTGILRDELGVLPPGDVRQCLVALSESSETMRELFNYRFSQGRLSGHNFGNLFLSALEKVSGDFGVAVKESSKILRIKGEVIPVTLDDINLEATLANGKKIKGEDDFQKSDLRSLESVKLCPSAKANPLAIQAIRSADKIVINSGNLYCSIIPNFLVKNLAAEIAKSKAKKIYVSNLMTTNGQTNNFSVQDFVALIEKYLGEGTLDYVIYNQEKPNQKVLKKYFSFGEEIVRYDRKRSAKKPKYLGFKLLSHKLPAEKKGDILKRTVIRHDSEKLAKIIYDL